MSEGVVRIGGASGFWGDSAVGAPQLVDVPGIRYVVFDYLAGLTMSILAAARAKNPELGYATDFVEVTARQVLQACKSRGIRLIANAGGVNPAACARALHRLAHDDVALPDHAVAELSLPPQAPGGRAAGLGALLLIGGTPRLTRRRSPATPFPS